MKLPDRRIKPISIPQSTVNVEISNSKRSDLAHF